MYEKVSAHAFLWRQKVSAVSGKLKYLGLLGLPMFIFEGGPWKYLWLFWLFGVLELGLNLPLFWQTCRQIAAIPYCLLTHRLTLPSIENHSGDVLYSLPFSGTWAVVNGDVNKARSHSWRIASQRYAYDFLILDAQGQSHCGDPTKVDSYYCYGQAVLAPADGVVVHAVDRFSDSLVDAKGNIYCGAEDIRGNHILIRHGKEEYSLVAHLKPGSVLVAPGDAVQRGEAIAQCGNSGHTSHPHIHFQVQDGPQAFAAAGVPIAFRDIEIGTPLEYAQLDPRPLKPSPLPARTGRQYIQRGHAVRNVVESQCRM